jgi:leader peptidase (prepilin peptidase)/N-methyltransferase
VEVPMTLFYVSTLFFFIFGAVSGGIFHLAALRWPKERSWRSMRSLIHPLSRASIPIISWSAEIVTGLLYSFAFILFGWRPELIFAIILFSYLSFFTWTDVYYRIIPNPIVLTGILMAIGFRIWTSEQPIKDYLLGGLIGFGVLFFIALVSRGGMGGGDIKLFSMIGFFIGWKGVLLSLMFSSLVGSLYGLYLMYTKKYKSKMNIPFAPSILIGTVMAYGWEENWIRWYIQLSGYNP